MKNFKSLKEFAEHLNKTRAIEEAHKIAALTAIGEYTKDKAKGKFGVYQEESGGFPAWQQLAESTQAERERLGFEPNNPLYRTGDLMESIDFKVTPNQVQVGSDSEIMIWQEEGTNGPHPIPPRPVLGPAMYESIDKIKYVLGTMMVNWLTGEKKIDKIR